MVADKHAESPLHMRRWLKYSLIAAVVWLAAALLATLLYPAVSPELPISLLWIANALAYGVVLATGMRLIPAFTLAALLWNILRGDAFGDVLIGTTAFMLVMVFVVLLSRLLDRRVAHDQAQRLLRVPIIAIGSASIFTALGVWQFTPGVPDRDLALALWLSEATAVLLFTPLAQQVLSRNAKKPWEKSQLRPITGVVSAWTLAAFIVLAALLLTSEHGQEREWLAYLALLIPMFAVYLMPTHVTRLAVALFIMSWVLVHYQVFSVDGVVHQQALIHGQLIIFTAALIAFLAIEAVLSFERSNQQLKIARLQDSVTELYNDLGANQHLRHFFHKHPRARLAVIGIQMPDPDDLATLIGYDQLHTTERRIAQAINAHRPPEAIGARLQPGLFVMLLINQSPTQATDTATQLAQYLATAETQGKIPTARQGLRIALLDQLQSQDAQKLTAILLMACQRAGMNLDQPFYHHREHSISLLSGHQAVLIWAHKLRSALKNDCQHGRFVLVAQPIINNHNREEQRAEILLRWQDPDGKQHSPQAFLSVAEDFGLMQQIDQWVLTNSLVQIAQHPHCAQLDEIAINLSGDSLTSDWLSDKVAELIHTHQYPAKRLCLEITETMLINDANIAAQNLAKLQALGVNIAIDDFGTGRATFAYLQQYPVDELKIDGCFIRPLVESGFDQQIVRVTRSLADQLNCRVVAEFVETQAQIELLDALGVTFLQGYALAKPRLLSHYLDELAARPDWSIKSNNA